MSLIKKANVKEHFAAKRRMRLIATGALSEPNATGFSEAEPAGTVMRARAFTEDIPLKHVSSSAPVISIAVVADAKETQAPEGSGNRQA